MLFISDYILGLIILPHYMGGYIYDLLWNIWNIMISFKYEEPIHIIIYNWISLGNLNINIGILLDSLSMIVMIPIGIVTTLVLLYSIEYMRYDPARNNFYIIISLFAIFMTLLIISDNYIIMFIGWELIGVISYLLISYWNTNIIAMKSALSAILINRMGDTGFIIFICLIISLYNSVEFNTLELLIPYTNTLILNILSIMLLIAATAKSSQLGLHSWLLHAMSSPTPVSSLLHAATMVCSGIYLLVRSSYILEYTPSILLIILWLGGITTLISGLIAIVSNDIKRIIALSTISQLAIMMIAIGSSSYDLAIYHLYIHAFFKSLLFMGAGSIIHSFISENQDIRKYGGLINYLPLNYVIMLIASLSLMAIPGLSGYYSKDIIIESLYGSYTLSGYILYFITLISATLTALYSIRLLYLTFFNNPNSNKYTYNILQDHNLPATPAGDHTRSMPRSNLTKHWLGIIPTEGGNNGFIYIPMIILTLYSIFLGYYRDNIIFILNIGLPNTNNFIETEFTLPFIIKYLPLILGLSLSLTFIYIYEYFYIQLLSTSNNNNNNNNGYLYYYIHKIIRQIYNYLNQRIYYDQILNNIIIRNILKLGGFFSIYIDNGLLKILGSTGLSRLLLFFYSNNPRPATPGEIVDLDRVNKIRTYERYNFITYLFITNLLLILLF